MKDRIEKLVEPQPAHLMYAYDGGWQVMKYVSENVFKKTDKEARDWYRKAEIWKTKAQHEDNMLVKYWQWSTFAGYNLAGFAQYLSAMTIVAIFVAIQFLVLSAWIIAASIAIFILAGFNLLHGYFYKIFFRCPDCHEQMKIPVFVCPTCATEHTRLWPSPYGVFNHRCEKCNTKLPTLDIHGRKELIRKCAVCKAPINKDVGRLINVHIPVIGGPSAGKSNFIFMATHQFIESYALPRSYVVEFPDDKHQLSYESNVKNLSSGKALRKTPEIVPQAYNLAVKRPRDRIGRIVYVYDAAGEAYINEDNTILQIYYKYVHGLIFIVDPFSIELYRRMHEDEINALRNEIRPSTLDVMEAYERMLTILEASVGLKRGSKFKHPIAVVVSKTDALGLENEIGHEAAQELLRQDTSIHFEEDAIHQLVEQFLVDHELGNFVRDLRLQFENVKFFSCSALGRLPSENDNKAYEPVRVLNPLLWILGQTKVVRLRQERVIKMDAEHKMHASTLDNIFKSAKYYYWDSLLVTSKHTPTSHE